MRSAELDLFVEGRAVPVDTQAAEYARSFGPSMRAEVIGETRPIGDSRDGWALVRFTGEDEEMDELHRSYFAEQER